MLKAILAKMAEKDVEVHEVKPHKMEDMCEAPSSMYYPTFYLSSRDLPEIKDWEVEGEYVVTLRLKQRSKSMHTEKNEEVYNADFDIKEIAFVEATEKPKTPPKKKSVTELYG